MDNKSKAVDIYDLYTTTTGIQTEKRDVNFSVNIALK